MARIHFALSFFALLMLVASVVVGFLIGDYNGLVAERKLRIDDQRQARPEITFEDENTRLQRLEAATSPQLRELSTEQLQEQFLAARQRKEFHFLLGLFAALVTLLVNAVCVTYFIGTSRWCREVVDAYGLDEHPAVESTRLKRKTFPWALFGILTVLAIATLGAASDPGGTSANPADWVMPHRLLAILGTALIAWAFLVQVGNVGANHELIEQILADVRRIRRERGLDEDEQPQGRAG